MYKTELARGYCQLWVGPLDVFFVFLVFLMMANLTLTSDFTVKNAGHFTHLILQ